jgi:hypothetical protein
MNLSLGTKYLLDGKEEVTVVKPFNKLATKYVVETVARTVVLVETQRLMPLQQVVVFQSGS